MLAFVAGEELHSKGDASKGIVKGAGYVNKGSGSGTGTGAGTGTGSEVVGIGRDRVTTGTGSEVVGIGRDLV